MNNKITFNDQDVAVFNFLKSINVDFNAVSIGIRDDNGWKGDDFMVKFTRNGKTLSTGHASGLGHRIVRGSSALTGEDRKELVKVNASVVIIDPRDWSNDDKITANKLKIAPKFCRVFAVSPCAASVLYGIQLDASLGMDSHKEFCANVGIDEDSRKGLENYMACQKIGNDYNSFFTQDERNKIEELLEDY